ncbi:Kelch repeat-containing protein [Aestuariivivens sediminicola]|uniref:Kelch repeat-containing protein n=1 Tax=Aestuariivivens sediminicola TaxID=2913560 RepID=UPI001F57DB36|nr:kelch repeat-containing protein [Aestuariivivens sediminicola]
MNLSITKHYYVFFVSLVVSIIPLSEITGQEAKEHNDPGARWGHVMIYDPVNKNMLLFGGTNKKGGEFLGDTWIWENNQWKQMTVSGPSARGFCAVTFDKVRRSIILHGGRGNNRVTYSDLWEWNGSVWSQIEENSDYKADHHQMVYLSNQNTILAFGGWNGEDVIGTTWMWSDGWHKLNIPSPPKRASYAMIYDEINNCALLYGGLWISGQYADLWKWSNNQWQSLSGPYDNSSLDHHAMIYDKKSNKIIGFGGKNYRYVFQNVTFKIENNQIHVIDRGGPTRRHSFGFTYDSYENFGYLYGGKAYVDGEQLPLNDFWRWDGEKWEALSQRNTE